MATKIVSTYKLETLNRIMSTAQNIAQTMNECGGNRKLHIHNIMWDRDSSHDYTVKGVWEFDDAPKDQEWQDVEMTFDVKGDYQGMKTKGERY